MDGFDIEGLGLRIGGRPKQTLVFAETRKLEPSDLASLNEVRESIAPTIKKLRERHHSLAKLIANGTHPGEAGLICGYSASRVSILQGDPAFRELVQFYREGAAERYFDGHKAMAELHVDAVEELRERMEDDPESFGNGFLLDLMKATADRTGLGVSTTTQVDVKVGLSDRLGAARERLARMRDVTPVENSVDPTNG